MSLRVKLGHCIVFFLILLSYKWRRICFKSSVRAAYGRPAISGSIYFLLADYSYQHPTILVKIFVGLDLCERCTRSLSIMDKLFPGSKELWIHNIFSMRSSDK